MYIMYTFSPQWCIITVQRETLAGENLVNHVKKSGWKKNWQKIEYHTSYNYKLITFAPYMWSADSCTTGEGCSIRLQVQTRKLFLLNSIMASFTFLLQSTVLGYHVYQAVWINLCIGDELV